MEYPKKEKQRNKRFLKTLGLSVSRIQIRPPRTEFVRCSASIFLDSKILFSASRRKIEIESEKVK